jgi:hypothetical protein
MSERILPVAQWRTSSYSGGSGTECVQVAELEQAVVTRDSKDPGGAVLAFTSAEWAAFVGAVKRGAFDLG